MGDTLPMRWLRFAPDQSAHKCWQCGNLYIIGGTKPPCEHVTIIPSVELQGASVIVNVPDTDEQGRMGDTTLDRLRDFLAGWPDNPMHNESIVGECHDRLTVGDLRALLALAEAALSVDIGRRIYGEEDPDLNDRYGTMRACVRAIAGDDYDDM